MQDLIAFAGAETQLPINPERFRTTSLQKRMLARPLPESQAVAAARENQPLLGLRDDLEVDDAETAARLTQELLASVFPAFRNLGPAFDPAMSDEQIRALVAEAAESYELLGMDAQIEATRQEAESYIGSRKSLLFLREEKLFRSGTFVPVHFLPDLFMATPVWYFAKTVRDDDNPRKNSHDPLPEALRFVCDQVPTERFADLFLAFNTKVRPIGSYEGEFMPAEVISLIRRARSAFDYVVVATPYHDVALADWEGDMPWARMPDPFVLGFQRGLPFMFVLGRYSGSCIFPLILELIADTAAFLRKHADVPSAELGARDIRRYNPQQRKERVTACGHTMTSFIKEALKAFDEGKLFDWLRTPTEP